MIEPDSKPLTDNSFPTTTKDDFNFTTMFLKRKLKNMILDQLEAVQNEEDGSKYKCKVCGKCGERNQIYMHINVHIQGVIFECLTCHIKRSSRMSMTGHFTKSRSCNFKKSKYRIFESDQGLKLKDCDMNKDQTLAVEDLFDYSLFEGSLKSK